jgi:hypothetical protein
MWYIMADMICHKVYEFLMSILIIFNIYIAQINMLYYMIK